MRLTGLGADENDYYTALLFCSSRLALAMTTACDSSAYQIRDPDGPATSAGSEKRCGKTIDEERPQCQSLARSLFLALDSLV